MTWKKLLAQHKVHTHTTSKKELDALRALIARDLADARIPGLSDDRRYATAYNAALQTGKMSISCAGYLCLPQTSSVYMRRRVRNVLSTAGG
jgi:hypothetical protein